MNLLVRSNETFSKAAPNGEKGILLIVGHQSPHPARAGNEIRLQQMSDALAASGWRVINIVAPLVDAEAQQVANDLKAWRHESVVVSRNGELWLRLGPEYFEVGLIHESVTQKEQRDSRGNGEQESCGTTLESKFVSDALLKAVKKLAEVMQPTAVIANYVFSTGIFLDLSAEVLRVVDTHDVFSSKAEKVVRYGIVDEIGLSVDEEGALLRRADLIIAIQDEEAILFREIAPEQRVITCGAAFPLTPQAQPLRPSLVVGVVGSANSINVDGLFRFEEAIWPRVVRKVPMARLIVAGDLSSHLRPTTPNAESLGHVPDMKDFYQRITVAANPSVAGTGLKMKTVEALAMGRACVTWPKGADGVDVEKVPHLHVSLSSENFASKLAELLVSPPDPECVAISLPRSLSNAEAFSDLLRVLEDRGNRG